MTTELRRPTPLDVANLRAAQRLEQLLAPGTLMKGERFRPLYEQGIRASGMTPHARLVALTLLTYATASTGDLPEERQPYLEGLVAATGLNSGQVVVQLRVLEQRGWVRRSRTGSALYEFALLRPVIPRIELARLRG
ncbi:hypothetical protein [Streptomyces sp. NPDC102487]|uniref:hypothetical protein n=1 Tax=Streptomyces sp. NPDC102487 TaxID=3366182 RepID=UPI00380B031C